VKRTRRYVYSNKHRCRATAVADDGPAPVVERCARKRGHNGEHRCSHGFHFSKDCGLKPD
jgi:hypothetical protein